MMVGNVDSLGISCTMDETSSTLGKLFLFLNGEKFGNFEYSYEVINVLQGIEHNLKIVKKFPEGFNINADSIFNSLQAVFTDNAYRDDCQLDSLYPGFWDEPGPLIDRITFYGGEYMLDNCSVVIFNNESFMKVCIRDRATKKTESIVVQKWLLEDLVKELICKITQL